MTTQTTTAANKNTTPTVPLDDVVRRGIPRELHCKLEDDELLRIARTRATKEAECDQLIGDLADETARRKQQIKLLTDEIGKMGRELRTGEQERTVKCNEVFRKHDDGTGWIYVIRLDTFAEVERRPATAHETQRYLPSLDSGTGGGLLEQAAKAQRSAQDDGVPEGLPTDDEAEGDDEDGDDADEGESKPTRRKKRS